MHLAWGFQPSHREDYLEELGVGGTRRVIEAATAAGVRHLVHMSSVGAYSPKRDDQPVDETWPTGGVRTSMYSRHKSAAERLLDQLEGGGSDLVVTRMRPGIVGQRSAGSALLRYGLPAVVPGRCSPTCPCCRSTGAWPSRWCTPTTSPTRWRGRSRPGCPAPSTSPPPRPSPPT